MDDSQFGYITKVKRKNPCSKIIEVFLWWGFLMIYMLLGDCKHKFVFPSSTLFRNSSLHAEWLCIMTLFHDADYKHELVHLLIFDADHNSTLLLRTSIGLLLVSTFEDTRLGRMPIFAWNKTGINLVLVLVCVMMYMHGIISSGPLYQAGIASGHTLSAVCSSTQVDTHIVYRGCNLSTFPTL